MRGNLILEHPVGNTHSSSACMCLHLNNSSYLTSTLRNSIFPVIPRQCNEWNG